MVNLTKMCCKYFHIYSSGGWRGAGVSPEHLKSVCWREREGLRFTRGWTAARSSLITEAAGAALTKLVVTTCNNQQF